MKAIRVEQSTDIAVVSHLDRTTFWVSAKNNNKNNSSSNNKMWNDPINVNQIGLGHTHTHTTHLSNQKASESAQRVWISRDGEKKKHAFDFFRSVFLLSDVCVTLDCYSLTTALIAK